MRFTLLPVLTSIIGLILLALPATSAWAGTLASPLAAQIIEDTDSPSRNAVVNVGPCTGTLISDNVVLTVAHCLPQSFRRPAPRLAVPADCTGLEQQAKLQHVGWEDPGTWYRLIKPANGHRLRVHIGLKSGASRMVGEVADYALPRCADLALLRLARRIPPGLARPLPVLTTPPESADHLLGLSRLRHAGWGMPTLAEAPSPVRMTGRVGFWGHNTCNIVGIPPLRVNGTRILPGDSGSPLIATIKQRDVVVGVLFGAGVPDIGMCGRIAPAPPADHGTYTPTWRAHITTTNSTDLGNWIATMVPQAPLDQPPQQRPALPIPSDD